MKRVVVIGAGPAGLAALRSLQKHKDRVQFVAYEHSDRVGGTWVIDDPYKLSSLYNNLRTNLPKEVMSYPGFPFPSDISTSFVSHKDVLKYLENFAQQHRLHQHIQFRHSVTVVDPVEDSNGRTEHWIVTVKDNENGTLTTSQFDSVLVCNGHFSNPVIPKIEGQETFPGEVLHSQKYRLPSLYDNKTVLILGAGPSGIDIAVDLSPHANKVYLSHNDALLTSHLPDNVEQVPGIEKISGADITLKDERVVKADVILLATGYKYFFPFLTEKCHPKVSADGRMVGSIYKMMTDISRPSMFYIGLAQQGAAFTHFHIQTEYAVQCIIGSIRQQSPQIMEEEYAKVYKLLVADKGGSHVLFHYIADYQWTYYRQLADECNVKQLGKAIELLYNHVSGARSKNRSDFRLEVYRLKNEENEFEIIATE